MKKYLPFISIWLVNTVLIYLAALVLPAYFVLGTHLITDLPGAVLSGFLLTAFCWAAKPIVASLRIKLEGRMQMFVFYWASNFVAIWLIARFSPYTGFGIAAYYWAIALGLVASFAQWVMWQVLKKDKLV